MPNENTCISQSTLVGQTDEIASFFLHCLSKYETNVSSLCILSWANNDKVLQILDLALQFLAHSFHLIVTSKSFITQGKVC